MLSQLCRRCPIADKDLRRLDAKPGENGTNRIRISDLTDANIMSCDAALPNTP